MRSRTSRAVLSAFAAIALAGPAEAATVSTDGYTLRVVAGPGEQNDVSIALDPTFLPPAVFTVRDAATQPLAGAGCLASLEPGVVTCPSTGVVRAEADLGDGPDSFSDTSHLGDRVTMSDRALDSAFCGPGKDTIRAEVLDELDLSCEAVDYGPPGKVGKLRAITGGGRFVPIPGQRGARIDRRILGNVLQLIRRYKIRIGDGYSLSRNHARAGEHPLGLAVDIYPGAGGSWSKVDKLARWAEPRRNRPRPPLRWVGYNGDYNHGRGNHLHLSWMHSKGRPGRPVRTVWAWKVLPR
jgi:hypothetical protein